MANTLKINESNVYDGIGTFTRTIIQSLDAQGNPDFMGDGPGMHYVGIHVDNIPPSGIIVTLAQTGSASVSVSTSSPSASQPAGHIEFSNIFNCSVGDVITVTLASSLPIDEQLNTVKSIIVIRRGQ